MAEVIGGALEFIGSVFEPVLEFLSLAPERPETPSGPRAVDTKHTLQQTDYPRTRIYGRDLVGGSLVSFRSHPPDIHRNFTQVIALNDAPSERMDYFWIDKDRMKIGQAGNPQASDDFRPANEEYPGVYPELEDWHVPRINGPTKGDKYIPLVDGARRWLIAFKVHRGEQTTPDTRLVNHIDPGNWWGSNYIGRGVCYAGVTWRSDSEVGFGRRMPELAFEGLWTRNIYDWRSSSTGYTANAALCMADWLMWEYGPFQQVDNAFAASLLTPSSFNSSVMISQANVCDEDVPLKAGGTHKRYTVNGAVTAAGDPERIFQQFFLAMGGGAITLRGREWVIRTGNVRPTVMALTHRDYAFPAGAGEGSKSVRTRRRHPTHARFNTVTGKCNDGRPGQSFEDTPYRERTIAAFKTADGNRRIPTTIDFDFVSGNNSMERAQRLADHQLQRHRAEITHTAPFKFTAGNPPGPWRLEPLDVVTLEDPELWTGTKEFWVKSKRFENRTGITHLTLREHFDFWDWDPNGVEEVELGTDTLAYDGRISAVTGLGASAIAGSAWVKADGTLWTKLLVTWNPHPNTIVQQRGGYRLKWKRTTESEYGAGANIDGSLVSHTIDVRNNLPYDIQIRAIDPDGNKGGWATLIHTPQDPQAGPEGPPTSSGIGENVLRDSQVRYDLGVIWEVRPSVGTITGTVTRQTDVGFHSTGALQTQATSGSVDAQLLFRDNTFYPVLPGQIWAFGASYRRERSRPARLKIRALWYDSAKVFVSSRVVVDRDHTNVAETGFSDWLDIGGPVMVPAGVAFLRYEVSQFVLAGSFPQTIQFDSMRLAKTNRSRGHYASGTVQATTGTWTTISGLGAPDGGNLYVRGEVDIHLTARINTRLSVTSGTTNVRSWVEVALVRTQTGLAGDVFNEMIEGPVRLAELPSGVAATGDADRNPSNWNSYVFDVANEQVPPGQWIFRILGRVQGNVASVTGDFKDRSMRLEIQESSMDTAV